MIRQDTIQSQLLQSLEKHSLSIAVEYGELHISYRQLAKKSRSIFRWIIGQGIPTGTPIGICLEDRVDIIAAIFGILQAGSLFMILETGLPIKRIHRMMETTNTKILICDPLQEEKLFPSQNTSSPHPDMKILALGKDFYKNTPQTGTQTTITPHPEDAIYIYFTSGSGGKPKALAGKNKSLLHFIRWEIHTFSISRGYRVSQFTNPGFDAFLRDIFVPLLSGGKICIPPNNDMPVHDGLINWIDSKRIDLIHCVPSIFRLFNTRQLTGENFKSLKYIMLSGEALAPVELKPWYETFGERIRLVNFYGPSETTMIKTFYPITAQDVERSSIPIGKPMRGAQVVICDKSMNPCDRGITGELYIRTPFATLGYCNDPEKTRQQFLPNPFNPKPGDFLYRTGDLALEMPDGNIELKGRQDRQVKIRGIRVQLEEIESALMEHRKVEKAVVLEKKGDQEDYLCAYFVLTTDKPGPVPEPESIPGSIPPGHMEPAPVATAENSTLSPEEQTRYKRQIMLDGWGEASQRKLKQTTVFAAGAGGSGSPLLMQLALQGFGTIIVCDYDTVELSNLNRQCLHDHTRLDTNKALSAKKTLEKINPHVTIIPQPERITAENVDQLVGDAAIIFDNVDDMETKFILSQCAQKNRIPHIISSMMDINAYAAVLYPPHSPCFHCLYDRNLVDQLSRLRAEAGSIETTTLASVSSSLFLSTGFAVTEALKIILGIGKPAYNKFFLFNQKGSPRTAETDGYRLVTFPFTAHFRESAQAQGFDWEKGWNGHFLEEFTVTPDPKCPLCRHHSPSTTAPPLETQGQNREQESKSTTITQLRDFLTGILPYYMIPTCFIPIEQIPLGPNGKIDQRRLPDAQVNALKTYIPPTNPVEIKLVEIWSDVLEIEKDKIGIETGFFELGGHSLKATVMISTINRTFGVSLPLAEVFRHPTVKHLARCLRQYQPNGTVTPATDDNLVLLSQGTDPNKNLFIVHAGNGEVEGYIQFANLLKSDFNYWGIRADRIKNYTPQQWRLEDIARNYIEKIKKIQPHEPYHIAGWCLGGPITFEMVYQLEQQQKKIDFFALIDSGAPLTRFYTLDKNDFTIKSEIKMIADLIQDPKMIKPLKKIKQWEQFWPQVVDYLESLNPDIQLLKQAISTHVPGKRRGVEMEVIPYSQQIGLRDLLYYFNQIRSLRNARARYTPPGKIHTPVHYFEASESKSKREFAEPWKDLCHHPMHWYEVEGGHFSIFEMPRVKSFAEQFNASGSQGDAL